MKQVAYITDSSGDWEGLYVDGKLVVENHSLCPRDVLEAVGAVFTQREIDMHPLSNLPENLTDLP